MICSYNILKTLITGIALQGYYKDCMVIECLRTLCIYSTQVLALFLPPDDKHRVTEYTKTMKLLIRSKGV